MPLPKRRHSSTRQAKRRTHYKLTPPTLTTCPECKAMRYEGQSCPLCHWRAVAKAKPVAVADGELGEVGRDRRITALQQNRLAFHRQLTWVARKRGYKDGWVAHKYREKFGDWPRQRSVSPMQPEPATLSWMRSRAIAYAKSRAVR